MGYGRTSNKVHAALINRTGMNTTAQQLAEATDLTEEQVNRAMYSLIKRDQQPITVVVPQQVWRLNGVETGTPQQARAVRAAKRELLQNDFVPALVEKALASTAPVADPEPKAEPIVEKVPAPSVVAKVVAQAEDTYLRVGRTSDGTVIVRDADGILYRVVAI